MKSNVKITFNEKALKDTISNAILNHSFDITCPKCNFRFPIYGSQLGKSVECPHCNVSIKLNDEQLRQKINNLKI